MSGPTWTDVNPALISIFGAIASPDEGTVPGQNWSAEWRDRKVTAVATSGIFKGVKLYLKITSVAGVGDDDRRLDFTSGIQETVYGLRRVTLNLQVTTQDSSDVSWGLAILERVRSRMRRRSVIDQLLALNIAIARIGTTTDISRKQDAHIQSRGNLDIVLTMVSSDADPVPTGWIAILEFSSAIQDVDGTTLPVPPNVTNVVITPP